MNSPPPRKPPVQKRRFFHDQGEDSNCPASPPSRDFSSPERKRRLFKDDATVKLENDEHGVLAECLEDGTTVRPTTINRSPPAYEPQESSMLFDPETFESLLGHKIGADTLKIIQQNCGNNLERAVNMYFDGTYNKPGRSPSQGLFASVPGSAASSATPNETGHASEEPAALLNIPRARYTGAFGVEGWATRNGVNVLKHGDKVKVERQKIQPPPSVKLKGKFGTVMTPRPNTAAARRVDVIVRFTSESGVEIGRLAKDTANWVSTLIDQGICEFEGTCVYAPERIRTNDTVFLQLTCFLLDSAFFRPTFRLADDRSDRYFEQRETVDEKELRLRQVALIRLFQELNLQPTLSNASAKEGRKGLLQVAEMDEQMQKDAKKQSNRGKESSSASNSDNEEGEELEQDQLDALYRKAQSFDFSTPETEPANTFAMTLRPYQKQALHWMMAKEKDEAVHGEPSMHPLWEAYEWPVKDFDEHDLPTVKGHTHFYVNPYSGDLSLDFPAQEQHCLGGILADEMGLGKTIQMLSLIHTHRPNVARRRSPATTLASVIHFPRLGVKSASLLEAPCTTLVVAPMSLLSQWKSEADKASKEGTLKIELYYGNEKSSNLQALCCSASVASAPDLVITSYGIVLSEFSSIVANNGNKAFHNGLFSLKFFRVILDEGHHIKNRASKTARACYELSAHHRWVLTGTPIVNKLEDLFSMVRFLCVEPWNNFSFWRTFITVPFESGEFVRALDVVQTVLEPLVMRRTKDMRTPDGQLLVPLPPKQIEIVEVELSRAERDVYEYIFTRAKRTFSKNIEAGTVMKAFTTIFTQILRLRQSCCHPTLVRNRDIVADEEEAGAAADAASGLADDMDLMTLIEQFTAATDEASQANKAYGAHALEEIRDEADKECPLCMEEPLNDQLVTGCWHSACKKCLVAYVKHEIDRGVVPRCFHCRAPLNQRDLFEVVRHVDEMDLFSKKPRISLQRMGVNASSAKICALVSELREVRRDNPNMKSVVFSQFTSFLSLIEPALSKAGVKYLRMDGSMSQKGRAAVLQEFTEKAGFTVLLMSLRAGGVGLNLTSAGRVFMMDPWWSFAVEAQAIDRVHRMGQEGEVLVKRFVVNGSVEQRMLRVQERKKFIASSLGMMSDEEKKLQRIEDIKELLS